MSDSWEPTTIGQSVRITKGVTYASTDYASEDDGHVFLTIKCFAKGGGFNTEGVKFYRGFYSPEQEIIPGELLVAKTDLTRDGDIIGSPMIAPDFGGDRKMLPSMDLSVLRAQNEDTDLRFLFYRLMLGDARRFMWAHSAGSTVLHLESKALPKFAFCIPMCGEQRRIAEILSTLDETIEQTEALIAKYQQIKAGLLHDLFTRGVTPNGKLRPTRTEAPQLYKESPLGWIPKKWEKKSLGECFTLQRGFDITQEQQVEGTVPVVSSSGVTSFHSVAMCQGPGVVIGRKGKLGNAYYLDGPHWPHDTTLWVKDFHGNDPRFTRYFLAWMRLDRFDAATSVPTLNRNFIHPLPVAIPRDGEQQEIVSRLDTHESLVRRIEQDVEKLQMLKYGLMHDLLTGRVRVKVDEL